eukprot:CAMPEP_0194529666 /NCGR_PEP_ID=MMETSP0253-20130528/66429_1 /TAXON_ID=2966 /ORGANISM="Noctiluca scintillans" /LENGTH=174 /DNA_ID=CAMNT_0039374823 /DNA_START=56 /DNA_END=580 /DNA_ORIENTATION=-
MGGDASTCKCCSAVKDDEDGRDNMPGVAVSQFPPMPEQQTAVGKSRYTEPEGDARQGSLEPGANPTLVPELPQSVKRQEQQPTELRIKLCREGKQATLGVDVAFDEDETSFYIEKMCQGLVKDWNTAHPDQKVEEGDQVVEVNGIRGNAMDMAEASRKDDVLELVIRRVGVPQP